MGASSIAHEIKWGDEANEVLQQTTHNVDQQLKHVKCLYAMYKLAEKEDISLNEIVQGIVNIIPPALQYPEMTCARIIFKGKAFKTKNFKETIWKQDCGIFMGGERIGSLDVYYLKKRPKSCEENFLKEERDLINAIAEQLGKIIKHKHAQEALSNSEEKARTLLNTPEAMLYMTDSNGIILDLNEQAAKHLGKNNVKELIGSCIYDFFSSELNKTIKEAADNAFRSAQPVRFQNQREGRIFEHSIYPIINSEEKATRVVCVIIDVTERKHAEKSLSESEAQKKTILDASIDRIRLSDKDMKIIWANQAHAKDRSISSEDMVGKPCYEVFMGRNSPCPECPTQRALRSGNTEHTVLVRPKLENTDKETYQDSYAVPIKDASDQIVNVLQVNRDITEQWLAEKNLRESEERYRTLFNGVAVGLYRTTPDGKILNANRALLEIMGYPNRDTGVHANAIELYVNPKDREIFKAAVEEQNTISGFETQLYRYDGTIVWVGINARVVKDSDGAILYYEGSLIDMTERKGAEKALKETEEFSSSLLKNSPYPIQVINPDTSIRYVNPALEKLTGFSSSELIGRKAPYPWWRKEVLYKATRDLEVAMRNGVQKLEEVFEKKNGEQFWAEITIAPIMDNGKLKYCLKNWVDISERKWAEKALQASKEYFQKLVENLPVGISVIKNGHIIYQNPEHKKLIGDLTESSQFQNLEHVHPEDVEKVKLFYQKLLSEKNENLDINFRFYLCDRKRSTDNMKWVQCQTCLAQYYGKKSILFSALDITKTKELERIVMMQDKMTSLGCVAAGIVHEIKNPLTGINTYLYTLEEACNSDTLEQEELEMTRQIVNQLKTASNKIESIIRRVMNFSRPGTPEMVLVDINQCLQEAINLSSASLRKARIEIVKSLAQGLPKCYANPNLIEQAILNLINNAAKAMEDINSTKKIKLTSFQKNSSIVMEVSDSGPGVPLGIRDKIFDPFFSNKDSMGIGLSIVQRIVADHGGYINVDTSEWGGAEFRIELPIGKKGGSR